MQAQNSLADGGRSQYSSSVGKLRITVRVVSTMTMMQQRAVVTPIATETGASVPSGTSDSENEARSKNSSGNSFWKNRRSHNPSSVPIPLLAATAPRRKGHRRQRRDPLKQPSFNTNSSADASGSLVSPRILAAMFLIMVVCVVLEVILVDCFFFGDDNHILRANGSGGKNSNSLLHVLIPNNDSHSAVHPNNESDANAVSVIPPSIDIAASTSISATDRNLRARHGQRQRRIREDSND
jgi:hypothetical protein